MTRALKKDERGMATLESVVLLVVFSVMVSYSLGFFGVVHTGIKNSIAARALAFETFRNRSNLSFRRDNDPKTGHYKSLGYRSHQIIQEESRENKLIATDRKIAFVRADSDSRRGEIEALVPPSLETAQADPVFIKTKYGICLTSGCGD